MKKLFVGAGIAMLAAIAPVPAQANGTTFVGGCGIATVREQNTTGDSGQGFVYLDVAPADASGVPTGGFVEAWCELRIDGVSYGTVLGPISGNGAVFGTARFAYTASPGQAVTWCVHVWSSTYEVICGSPTTVFVDSSQLSEVVTRAEAALDLVLGVVNHDVLPLVTPEICDLLTAAAPAVNMVFNPGFLHVDPATGDVYVNGAHDWDCTPPAAPDRVARPDRATEGV